MSGLNSIIHGAPLWRSSRMERELQTELLDVLPAEDPAAIHSRRDLRRFNLLMFHAGIIARTLSATFGNRVPQRLVDLGAGDGTFLLSVARRLCPLWPNLEVTLVDRQNLVCPNTLAAFREIGWSPRPTGADVFEWLEQSEEQGSNILVANLFLHHFSTPQLERLFRSAGRRAFGLVALDPRRSRWPLAWCRLLWMIGCNHVSRHDARASVRAGFRDHELSSWWPPNNGWALTEREAGPFSHLFVARRLEMSPTETVT